MKFVSIPQAVSSSCNSVLGNAHQDWIKNRDLDHRRIFFDFLPKSLWTAFLFFLKMPLKPAWFLRFFCPPLCWIIVFPTFLYYSGFAGFLSMRQSMIRFLTIHVLTIFNLYSTIKSKTAAPDSSNDGHVLTFSLLSSTFVSYFLIVFSLLTDFV